jgi:hypothetical protein
MGAVGVALGEHFRLGPVRRRGPRLGGLADWFGGMPPHNIAFGAQPGVLWAGTAAGALIRANLNSGRAAMHHVLGGFPVTALSTMAGGDLIVATGEGDLALVSVTAAHPTALALEASQARAAAFLAGTPRFPTTATTSLTWS